MCSNEPPCKPTAIVIVEGGAGMKYQSASQTDANTLSSAVKARKTIRRSHLNGDPPNHILAGATPGPLWVKARHDGLSRDVRSYPYHGYRLTALRVRLVPEADVTALGSGVHRSEEPTHELQA